MSFSSFFIGRPIFSAVISITIVIAGLMAARGLPIAQYPQIAPPTVIITANYPGASTETLTRTVAGPIEEQLSGVRPGSDASHCEPPSGRSGLAGVVQTSAVTRQARYSRSSTPRRMTRSPITTSECRSICPR